MVQTEFSPVNYPLSPFTPAPHPLPPTLLSLNSSFQIPSDEFKNHLTNITYFLLKRNLDSRSKIYSSLILIKVQQNGMWHAQRLAQAVGNSF